jgi:hypothetical protein
VRDKMVGVFVMREDVDEQLPFRRQPVAQDRGRSGASNQQSEPTGAIIAVGHE